MTRPKIVTFYLPQFHTFPENDEWWGKGFTEWTNVKRALPLFRGHNQPRIPLDNNYYNLLDPRTFEWQVGLALKYGIDGFCFYHYWFNGKLLLHKPVEDFLNRKELNLSFCLSWANEPWARTWDGQNKNVLMPQSYNGDEDIINHFNYLLPFFKDERYIKIGNRPVFVIYRANSITYLDRMIPIWNKLANENGLGNIYFIETLTGFSKEKYSDRTDGIVYMEPMYVLEQRDFFHRAISVIRSPKLRNQRVDYKYLWKSIIKKENLSENRWAGAFCDWDNSARKKKRNLVVVNTNINVFENFFKKLYLKAEKEQSPYIFINAWNEWAEGTYLEPDEKNKYIYLETIKAIKNNE